MENKVSIILPTFNSEKTINDTIVSVLNQTYNNIELIIVDDGSKDNTINICMKYEKDDNRVRFFTKENSGVSNTRNIALKKSTGKYIMFIDADDLYCEEYVKKMVDTIEKDNVELSICGCKRINNLMNKETNIYVKEHIYDKQEFDNLIEQMQKEDLFNQIWNKIFIKKIIDDNGIKFDENISLGEDFRFVIQYINYINKVKTLNEILYVYTNSTNGLNMKYRKDRLEVKISNVEVLEEYFINNNFELEYINKKYVISILSGIKNICLNPNKSEIKEELKRLRENKLIMEKLDKKSDIKYNVISKILKMSGVHLLKFYGKLLILYDKTYKKFKFGY